MTVPTRPGTVPPELAGVFDEGEVIPGDPATDVVRHGVALPAAVAVELAVAALETGDCYDGWARAERFPYWPVGWCPRCGRWTVPMVLGWREEAVLVECECGYSPVASVFWATAEAVGRVFVDVEDWYFPFDALDV